MMNRDTHLKTVRKLAYFMDRSFNIAGIPVGLDPIIGIIPGLGDLIPALMSLYTILIALQYQVPGSIVARMVFNVAVDLIVGSIPIFGDVADVFIRANTKNYQLLEKYLAANGEPAATPQLT